MRLLVMVFLSLRLFASSFEEIEPSTPDEIVSLHSSLLIDGYVSVSSGQIVMCETDLCVKGAQDVSLKRIYITPQILGRYKKDKKEDLLFTLYELKQNQLKGWVVHPHLKIGYNRNSGYFQIRDPQGCVLGFEVQGNKGILKTAAYGCSNLCGEEPRGASDLRNIQMEVENRQIKVVWPDGTERHYSPNLQGWGYLLRKEILPNGKAIYYELNEDRLQIRSSDPTGKHTYASITETAPDQYQGSDGRKVNLVYKSKTVKGKSTTKPSKSVESPFRVLDRSEHPSYTNRSGYNEKTLLNSYDAQNYPISCTYVEHRHELCRLETFSNPSGSFSFSYDPAVAGRKGGSTTVTHPDQAQTVYRFNKLLLLEGIENWYENKLVNKKTFEYDSKQHIKSIETLDENGRLLIAKRFECDEAGNATLEKIEGDFGTFSIRRKFDQNRLVFEDREDGLQTAFTYLGKTWLPTSKTLYEKIPEDDFFKPGKLLRNTIYSYDEANNLIQKEEEGKTKTIYTLRQKAPHLHRVEEEGIRDWKGKLIHKIQYEYDSWGNTNQERHFGSDGQIAYTIKRTYNEKGELLDETNPVGEKAVYKYDERGRCSYEEPFSNGLVVRREFDVKGRLKLLEENDHKTTFSYNASDELTEKTDYLGYITKYHYHPVHGKPDQIEEPFAITQITYDSFGGEKEIADPYKIKRQKTYDSYGNISSLTDPDGGKETFTYYPNGLLEKHTDPDHLVTSYLYDPLGRTKEKTIGSYTTTYRYDGYNLYELEDAAGLITQYEYDLSGKKTKEIKDSRVTEYEYDSLGFLSLEKRGKLLTKYTNDCLGRPLEKTLQDTLKTSWTYDAGGNVATLEQGGITRFVFDAHNRLIEETDPENHKTTISYEKHPQFLRKQKIDPAGIVTIEDYNPKGQLLKRKVGEQITEECEYDKLFRLKRRDHLTFSYTANGQKQSIQEAHQRATSWTYTPGNRLLTKTKPDQTVLLYEYDTQLRLEKVGTREFHYDPLNRIIGGTGFSRQLDPFGNVKREEWANGLWIESDYDEWDRPILRTLPDQSQIKYTYEGPFLKKISRVSSQGDELYSHSYKEYDAKGNPIREIGLFETSSAYDKLGRKVSQKNPFFKEISEYNPSGNLIRRGNCTYTYDSLSQMTSESGRFDAEYDTHYNLTKLNGEPLVINSLNQIEGLNYNLNGNLIKPGFIYDAFDQLIQSDGEICHYDALGRRFQKGETSYLYIGNEEIGAFEQGIAKEPKIPGLTAPVAIEINQKPYTPIADVQGTIRLLINSKTAEIFKRNHCDAFGSGLSNDIPYAYAGKRYDPKTGLLYFGKRYYDPSLRRWLTPDPIGPEDHSNLYQYVFNNPFRYQDPTGESIGGYLLGLGEIVLGGAIIAGGFALEVVTVGGFTLGLGVTTNTGFALMGLGVATTTYHAQDIKMPNISWKNTNPFNGPVDEEVLVVDPQGNVIPVQEGNWLTGSKDGKWLQEMRPGEKPEGIPTGRRKDGGHKPGPKHPDPKAWGPHGHVPGITNLDGTPWLPIY